MEKKQSAKHKTNRTKPNKRTSTSLKRDKLAVEKSAKRNTIKKPIAKSTTHNIETQDSHKEKTGGFIGSVIKSWFIWEIVIPVGVALFSIIFFITQWSLGLFTKGDNKIIWLTVAVFGIGGATTVWLWKRDVSLPR